MFTHDGVAPKAKPKSPGGKEGKGKGDKGGRDSGRSSRSASREPLSKAYPDDPGAVLWDEVKTRKDDNGKSLCVYYWTADRCKRENCPYSHAHEARGARLVSDAESSKLTAFRRKADIGLSHPLQSGTPRSAKGGEKGGKGKDRKGKGKGKPEDTDIKGMCRKEEKGAKKCDNERCIFMHRRTDSAGRKYQDTPRDQWPKGLAEELQAKGKL